MDAGLLSFIGILIALVVLVIGSYRGYPILLIGPIASLIVIVFSGLPIIESFTGEYADSFAGFVRSNFLIFLPATILGAMIGDSGAAQSIANKIYQWTSKIKGTGKVKNYWVLMGLSAITAILSFGGVSGFVVIFTIAPICLTIFKKLDIPWHMIIAVAVYGGSMWTAILPGSPAIQNLIPIEYLGTNPMSAPWLGILGALNCIIFGAWYIWFMLGRAEKQQEGFTLTGAKMDANSADLDMSAIEQETSLAEFIRALTPSISLLVLMNVFQISPFVSLTLACVVCWVLYYNKFADLSKTLNSGANSTMKAIMNVAAVVGFGGIVSIAPGFDYLVANLDAIPGPPLVQLALATNIVAGITGSASGGEAIALEVFAPRFLEMGINPHVIHRLVNISCYGLDSLPHNGSAINRLNYTHLTHREGYYHEFWLGAIFPFINSFIVVFYATLGIV
ncbi:GntP family permease [Fundicoccus culcitae]|uniref:GntP family permease n=1 Tax=Fundicoccus culcitae TaxID=2969821 RepID=A0ABY5P7Q8_9LACT|nr:GntP family permease [Fundicoccus culcitae]UUX34772.1 GntP family permease [Fundicoccus culcitae]